MVGRADVTPTARLAGVLFGAARLLWALVLLRAPGRLLLAIGGDDAAGGRVVMRLLGIRHLLQGGIEIAVWPRWSRIGSAVDALHAASGVAFGTADRRSRRPAFIDAAIASCFALGGIVVAEIDGRPGSTGRAPLGSHD